MGIEKAENLSNGEGYVCRPSVGVTCDLFGLPNKVDFEKVLAIARVQHPIRSMQLEREGLECRVMHSRALCYYWPLRQVCRQGPHDATAIAMCPSDRVEIFRQ